MPYTSIKNDLMTVCNVIMTKTLELYLKKQ